MNFADLPEEILLLICDRLRTQRDIYVLVITCVKFYRIFIAQLYKYNATYSNGSAMAWCIVRDNLEGVRLLLRYGARFRPRMAILPFRWDFDEDFGGVLHLTRSLTMGRFLLDQGAEINELSDFGRTPLHVAVENGDLAMAALLLQSGAAVNANGRKNLGPSFFHYTPLKCALRLTCDDVKLDMVKLLIEYGADLIFFGGTSLPLAFSSPLPEHSLYGFTHADYAATDVSRRSFYLL